MLRIDTAKALEYMHENFSLSADAGRLCMGVFDALNDFDAHGTGLRLMTSILDNVGFDESDLRKLKATGAVQIIE